MGVPTVAIVIDPFKLDAKAANDEEGMNLRSVFSSFPFDQKGADAREKAKPMMDEIVSGLTAPLTEIEKSPKPKEVEKLSRIPFKGTLEEVQQFFQNRRWTDGLPVIPPTEEAVKKMLAKTSHHADEVIGIMPPESWVATVEGIAVNGVMAGCQPEHMPVLLAEADAFISEPMFYNFVRSAGSYGFIQVVNGPIAAEIGMNSGTNALGPGSLANACIGRALRLFIINQGGSVPGVNLLAAFGNPLARGIAFAENEKASPWQPYHVDRGFKAEESVLTIFGGEGGFENQSFDDIIKILKINKHRSSAVILMGPLSAKLLIERKGFRKKSDLQKWLWDNTKMTIEEWRDSVFYQNSMVPLLGKPGHHPTWYADPKLPPDTMVNIFPNPDSLHIIVVGDPGGAGECQIWQMGMPSSVSIDKWR
jgi:hypothetical protein